jgi:thiamine-phosphate diphosphorylase
MIPLPAEPILYHISAGSAPEGACPMPCFVGLEDAGVPLLQIREPRLSVRDVLALAARLRRRCNRALILLNDRFDVARAAGLDGVHLRSDSLPVERVRALAGPDFIIGRSAHDLSEVLAAEAGGADFVVLGPVFPTPSKAGRPALGLARLREIRRRATIPILALGGIQADNAAAVLDCGVAGLAGIRFFHDERQLASVRSLVGRRRAEGMPGRQTGQDWR